jgi:serine/threonine-protein kinase
MHAESSTPVLRAESSVDWAQPSRRWAGTFELREGDLIADRYRVEREIGRGGMGVVVAVVETETDRRFAIKILLPSRAADPDSVERFLREATACVQLSGEHTARVYEVGSLPDGAPFLVMDLLSGRDFAAVLREVGPLEVRDAVDLVLQAAEGVAEAHAVGIIHRDLKPGNLFLTTGADGRSNVKVLDFGLAKRAYDPNGLTTSAAIMGSPCYMSPEQMRRTRDVDERADIWSLGVTLYEMLIGVNPFDAPHFPDVIVKVLEDPAPPPHTLRAEIPAELSRVVMRCLEKNAGARFQDVAELARALEAFGSRAANKTRARIDDLLARPHAPISTKPAPPRRLFRWSSLVVAVALGAAVAAAAYRARVGTVAAAPALARDVSALVAPQASEFAPPEAPAAAPPPAVRTARPKAAAPTRPAPAPTRVPDPAARW